MSSSLKWVNDRAPLSLIVAVLLTVAGARFGLIERYGSDVPWGDQWYGEVARTYAPWLEGKFGPAELFGLHNEHRIVATRVLDLVMLESIGQWDPRAQVVVNTLIVLAALAVLLRHLARHLSPPALLLVALVSVILFGSDDLWENTLCGFQSQFYFLLFFSLVHLLQTVNARPFSAGWWTGQAAGLCNLFSMAAGPISAGAVICWWMWCRLRAKEAAPGDRFTLTWNLALVIVGWLLLPYSPTAGHLGSTAPLDQGKELLHLLSWPVVQWQVGLIIWAPVLVFAGRVVIWPPSRAECGWLIAFVSLAVLFILATALARGGIASRYGELFSLGILANLLCLIVWASHARRKAAALGLGGIWLMAVLLGLHRREVLAGEITLQHEPALIRERARCIRNFLGDGNEKPLRANDRFSELDIGVLRAVRESPALLRILPYSIRPSIAVPFGDSADGFRMGGAPLLENEVAALPVLGTWKPEGGGRKGVWISAPVRTTAALVAFSVAGEISPPNTELYLQTADGLKIRPMQETTMSPTHWRQVNFINPSQPFQIVAAVSNAGHWLAFSAPREYAAGSWLTTKVLRSGSALYFAGWILLLGVSAKRLGGTLRMGSHASVQRLRVE